MRTLLLAPHHDDETLFASYLCLTYRPYVVVCFGQPEANGVRPEVRSNELHMAMAELDVPAFEEWPLSDHELDVRELVVQMAEVAAADRWDIVFAPAPELNGHPQHNLIGALATAVFSPGTLVEHYMTYTYPPLKRSRSEREVGFDPSWVFRKHAALGCYRSAGNTPSYRHFAEDLSEYLAVT